MFKRSPNQDEKLAISESLKALILIFCRGATSQFAIYFDEPGARTSARLRTGCQNQNRVPEPEPGARTSAQSTELGAKPVPNQYPLSLTEIEGKNQL